MAESSVLAIVGVFIAIVVMLGIGTQILGNVSFSCEDLDGYNSTTPGDSTGWAASCLEVQENSISGYNLLVIIVIVVAAVGILFVVRMLG